MVRMLSYTEAIAEALVQAMEFDQDVFLMGEGVDGITGIYGTVLPAFKRFGEKRVIDTPISENSLTGFAIGAAMDGMRPVLFHQRNDFMMLAMDQMVNHAAKIPYMSGGKHKVPLTIVSFVARKIGEGAQHTQSLQSIFAHFPGMKVVMPATPSDAKGMLLAAIADDDPVIVLYHRDLFTEKADVQEVMYQQPLGYCNFVRLGRSITVVAVSATVRDALSAASELYEKDGINVEIIDPRSIRPLHESAILESVRRTGRLLVVDTGWEFCGISAEILALVSEKAFSSLKTAPRRIGMRDTPAPAAPSLLENYHPNKEVIVRVIKEMMKL